MLIMTTKLEIAQFHPYLYTFDIDALDGRVAVRYSMPFRAYEALQKAQGIPSGQNVNLGGLAAVLGWAAPAIDLITFEYIEKGNFTKTLCFWMIDASISTTELKHQVQVALDIWLGLTLQPEKLESIRTIMHDGRYSAGGRCETLKITSAMKAGGACARPVDSRVYSLLTLYAARLLEGATINEGTPDEGELISTGAQNDLYGGKSLLRYRPSEIERGRKTGLWCEVFNVVALNTLEHHNLRIAVNISIRNFGTINPASLKWHKSRYLDIFLPPDFSLSHSTERVRCVQLEVRKRDFDSDLSETSTESQDRFVLMRMLEMSGVRERPNEIGLEPFELNGFSMYPRTGANHGDRNALAGTGIPLPERESYLHFLDRRLLDAGFSRVRFTKRRSHQTKLFHAVRTPQQLRAAVTIATGSFEADGGLRFSHFVDGDGSNDYTKAALLSLFGEPSISENGSGLARWKYDDGFAIDWHKIDTGPMSEKVPQIDEDSIAALKASGNKVMLRAAIRDLWRKAGQQASEKILTHVKNACINDGASWAALVEIPDYRSEDSRRDPFLLNYLALAQAGGVAQTKLVSTAEIDRQDDPEEYDNVQRRTFENALRDLLRSVGVSPVMNDTFRLAGWWILNRNNKRFDRRPGELDGLLTPLYADCICGQLRVCVLNTRGEPEWLSYAEALKKVLLRQVFDFSKLKQSEQSARIEQFFAAVTPVDDVPTVLFTEATNIRQFVKGLGNDALEFDTVRLGAVGGAAPHRTIKTGGAISLVRVTNETAKAPCYFVGSRKLGYSKSLFQENGSQNVYWLNRGLTQVLHRGHGWANRISRQGETHFKKYAHRRFPSLGEIAIVIKAAGMRADQLAGITRKAMHSHLTTDEEVLLPFPLHELAKLK